MLLASVDGEALETIADYWQCTVANVNHHTMKLRRKLRAWASWRAV